MHCLKYGLTVHNILSLKVITIEGDLLEIGGQGLDAPGYDLLALMTGSEGMLGIIVEASLKLLPKPLTTQILLAAFDQIETAGNSVAAIIAAGVPVVMWRIATGSSIGDRCSCRFRSACWALRRGRSAGARFALPKPKIPPRLAG